MSFVTAQPLWLLGILFLVLTSAAMAGPFLVRRRIALDRLRTNNEVAGFKFATVGVLYAVMLAFAVIVVWEKFEDADTAVGQEAAAATTIYILSHSIDEQTGATVRDRMSGFLKAVIDKDWPAMAKGSESPDVTRALEGVYGSLLAYRPNDRAGAVTLGETLRQLDQIATIRRELLVMSKGVVPGILWLVLFGGAAITIGFTFFFGTANVRAQSMMTGALAALIFGGLLVIIAIDDPFLGTVSIDSAPLAQVLHEFGTH